MPPVERRMKDVLRCPEKQNNYDETDIHSIFQYGQHEQIGTFAAGKLRCSFLRTLLFGSTSV